MPNSPGNFAIEALVYLFEADSSRDFDRRWFDLQNDPKYEELWKLIEEMATDCELLDDSDRDD